MLPPEAGGGADLRRGVEALTTFKKRVDTILKSFESSPGSSKHVANHRISRAALGGHAGFGQADDLFAKYNEVHERLTTLSRSLGLQIEAMGIAVHGADIGFNNLEDDQRRRFYEIQAQIRANDKNPNARKHNDAQQGTGAS